MYILSFNTSSNKASVSISKKDQIIFAKKSHKENSQAEELVLMIEESLKACSLEYSDLNYIGVCNGPGSFTGIRIGLSVAKAMNLSLKKLSKNFLAAITVTNFELINYRAREQYKKYDYVVSLVDAARGEFYVQVFDRAGNKLDFCTIFKLDFFTYISQFPGLKIISGSGLKDLYPEIYPDKNFILLPRFPYPDSRFICKIAY